MAKRKCIICRKHEQAVVFFPVCALKTCHDAWIMVGGCGHDASQLARACNDADVLDAALAYELRCANRGSVVRSIRARQICLGATQREQALAKVCTDEEAIQIAKKTAVAQ